MEKRIRAFAAWLGSFTACCCCMPGGVVQNPNPGPPIVIGEQPPQPKPPIDKTDGDDGKKLEKPKKKKAGGDTKVTRANFDKIQNGMTIAQVEAILGPGEEFGTKPGMEQRNFLWRNLNIGPPPTINIIFRNDVVATKHMAP
jgi:hypothetical protein